MPRNLFAIIALGVIGAAAVGYACADVDDDSPRKNAVAELAAKFEYPGNRAKEYNAGEIYQSITTTPDDLEKVNLWYRKQLHILRSTSEGAEYTKRPDLHLDRATTVFHDGYRPKGSGQSGLDIRADSTFSFVYRVPEATVVVVINRAAGDKLSVVSLSLIPGKMEPEKKD